MAPALTEPLSPTDKLSSSTPTTALPSTRSAKIVDISIASTATPHLAREKRIRTLSTRYNYNNITPTTSTRAAAARCKNAVAVDTQKINNTNTNKIANNLKRKDTPLLNSADKITIISDEQMGLSAATTTATHNNNNISNNDKEIHTAKQLLDNLTVDFEEAISAEICYRSQLPEVKVADAAETACSADNQTALEDILVLKADDEKQFNSHMESVVNKNDNKDESMNMKDGGDDDDEIVEKKPETSDEVTTKQAELDEVKKEETNLITDMVETTKPKNNQIKEDQQQQQQDLFDDVANSPFALDKTIVDENLVLERQAQIVSVVELPPISTDSTMTASEVEDNLEERLSQLDGSAAIDSIVFNTDTESPFKVINETLVNDAILDDIPTTSTSSLCNLTGAQSMQQQQEQSQQTQNVQNNNMSPTTPKTPTTHTETLLSQQQNLNLTPQSTSSINSIISVLPQTNANEFDHDIEEVLKALKGFDSTAANDTLGDLNMLFNEVYTMNMDEIVTLRPSTPTHTHTHATTPPQVKPNPLKEMQTEIERKQFSLQRKIDFLLRRLRKDQTRHMCKHSSEEVAGLFEWSARLVGKGGGIHTNTEDLDDKSNEKVVQHIISARPPATKWAAERAKMLPATQMNAMLRKLENTANAQQISYNATSSTVNLKQFVNPYVRKSKKQEVAAALAAATAISQERKTETYVPYFSSSVANELSQVSGLLHSELREVQNAIDSDATESSSGCESADEMIPYNNQIQQAMSIAKRAAWRYSRDRAGIVSRWAWLLTQVADLEIKIRQHGELHQEISRTKGPILFDAPIKKDVDDDNDIIKPKKLLTCNGNKDDLNFLMADELDAEHSIIVNMDNIDPEEAGASRTRAFNATHFRKRKLLQTTNIHTISKKAARPSNIKCGCQWPLMPCGLCTGRSDPTAPRDLHETMSMAERIALLDPGYHAVLSFPEDVSSALHFEAIARLPEWQQRLMRLQVRSTVKNAYKIEAAGKSKSGEVPTKRRYIKKKDRVQQAKSGDNGIIKNHAIENSNNKLDPEVAAAVPASAAVATPLGANKLNPCGQQAEDNNSLNQQTTAVSSALGKQQQSMTDYQHNRSPIPSSLISNQNINNLSGNSSKNNKYQRKNLASTPNHHHTNNTFNSHYNSNSNADHLHNDYWDPSFATAPSRHTSPTYVGVGSNQYKYERTTERKNRTSYDIDNIVIPYSVAATTRVEILPYKEIPTPKWRVVDKNAKHDELSQLSEDEEEEQVKKEESVELQMPITPINPNGFKLLGNLSESSAGDVATTTTTDAIKNTNAATEAVDNKSIDFLKPSDAVSKQSEERKIKKIMDDLESSEPMIKKSKLMDSPALPPSYICSKKEKTDNADNADLNEDEDISNDAMVLRHERALAEERRKFSTYLRFPWSTRSRANRRIDSRAESSGANTPDPSSPAPTAPSNTGGDQDSIPSPLATTTTANPLDSIAETGEYGTMGLASCYNASKRNERRRTTSGKRDYDRRSPSPDPKDFVAPYEPLKFPLEEDVFNQLLGAMPMDYTFDNYNDFTVITNSTMPGKLGATSTIVHNNEAQANNLIKHQLTKIDNLNNHRSKMNQQQQQLLNDLSSLDSYFNDNILIAASNTDDDGYPKHHLAPNESIYDSNTWTNLSASGVARALLDSDNESTESDPFQEDDPNDPEWKREKRNTSGRDEQRVRKKAKA